MSIAASIPAVNRTLSVRARRSHSDGAAFKVFLLINAALFLRPGEIVPGLEGLPIYQVLNLVCIGLCISALWAKVTNATVASAPITVCVVALVFAVLMSHLWFLEVDSAIECFNEFFKVVVYYLLLVTLVNSPQRLRRFLMVLVFFTSALTAVSLLQFHGYIN